MDFIGKIRTNLKIVGNMKNTDMTGDERRRRDAAIIGMSSLLFYQ